MLSIIYHLIFLFASIYIFLKLIGYAIYEINTQNNKYGGIAIISFSLVVVIFSNVMVWIN